MSASTSRGHGQAHGQAQGQAPANTLGLPIPEGTEFKDRAEGVSLFDKDSGLYVKYFRNPENVMIKMEKMGALHKASPSHTVGVHGPVFMGCRIAGLTMDYIPDAQDLRALTDARNERPMLPASASASSNILDPSTREIISQMRDALKELHAHGIHHSDLNYTNVLVGHVDGKLRVYLIDPGVSRCENAESGFKCNDPQHFVREKQRMEDMIFSFINGQPDKRFF